MSAVLNRKSGLDPRTKMAVLVVLSIVMMGGFYQTSFHYLPALLPFVMLLCSRRWAGAVRYTLIFGICMLLQAVVLPKASGPAGFLLAACCVLPLYFIPTIGAAEVLISTTTAGEFVAAMERMHMPRAITVSTAVIFRFFPTLLEEWRAIADAMKMRGVGLFGKKAGSFLEYRLVPMLMCSVKIGDELSAASLTRGLDSECRRTNIQEIGFHSWDYVVLGLCAAMLAAQAYFWIGGAAV